MLLSPLLALFYAISFDISLQYLRSISSIVLIRCNKVSYFFHNGQLFINTRNIQFCISEKSRHIPSSIIRVRSIR